MTNIFKSYIAKMLSIFFFCLIFGNLLKRAHCTPVFDLNSNLNEKLSALIASNPSLRKVQHTGKTERSDLENLLYYLMLRKSFLKTGNFDPENFKADHRLLYRALRSNGKPTFIRFGKRAAPAFIRFGKRGQLETLMDENDKNILYNNELRSDSAISQNLSNRKLTDY